MELSSGVTKYHKTFRIKKKSKKKGVSMDSLREMKMLPLYSQCLYSLMQYVVNNRYLFTRNSEVHNKGSRQILTYSPQVSLLLNFKRELLFRHKDL
jgi:hypothetical protein